MIWIATLCLLFIAAWLLFNGLNEKRWVEAHLHDETVASDEGFVPSFASIVERMTPTGDGPLGIGRADSGFARSVRKAQATTEQSVRKVQATKDRYGERFVEARTRAATGEGPAADAGLFDHMVDKVSKLESKVDARLAAAVNRGADSDDADPGFIDRVALKLAAKEEEFSGRVQAGIRRVVPQDGARPATAGEESLVGRAVGKVSSMLNAPDTRTDDPASPAPADSSTVSGAGDDEFASRVSAKVGQKIDELDGRVGDKSKDAGNRNDRS